MYAIDSIEVPLRSAASKASRSGAAYEIGIVFSSYGDCWNRGKQAWETGERYDVGDEITVTLDIDASAVRFRKNGTAVGAQVSTAAVARRYTEAEPKAKLWERESGGKPGP